MHRFYCPNAVFTQKTIFITDGNEVHHIKDVLRLKAGDTVAVFNSRSQEAQATIVAIKNNGVEVRPQAVKEAAGRGTKIILACAVPKKAKFEFIIEKCTELGVDEIIPLRTKRTEVIFAKEKVAAKQARFQKVAVNAAKQCGRLDVPKIHPMTPLAEALKMCSVGNLAMIPSLNGQPRHIREVLNHLSFPNALIGNPNSGPPIKAFGGDIFIFIGPEGDFTPDEVQMAQDHGCVPVSLGTTVLKVDTAAISTVALIRFLCN